MVAQPFVEHFLGDELAFVVVEHPVGKLRVPDEAVSAHLDAVLAAEVGNAVCFFPFPDARSRMNLAGLHDVLAGHTVELLPDEVLLGSITHVSRVE